MGVHSVIGEEAEPVNAYQREAAKLLRRYHLTLRPVSGYYGSAPWHSDQITAPDPRSPLRFAIFLHEMGHKVLGHARGTVWRQEAAAWSWALARYRLTTGRPPSVVLRRARRGIRAHLRMAARRKARGLERFAQITLD